MHSVSYSPTSSSFPPSSLNPIFFAFPIPLFVATHSPRRQHRGVVVDVRDSDDGSGCIGEAEVQVALHVCSLHDDGILGHFLSEAETEKKKHSMQSSTKQFLFI